jgi:hypothetical protein
VAAAGASFTIPIACNGVVKRIIIQVDKGDADGEDDVTQASKLRKVTLDGSGRNLLSYDGDELLYLGNGSRRTAINASIKNKYIIDFSSGKRLPGFDG